MADAEPLEVRLWLASQREPRAATPLPPNGLLLTRDTLGVSDSRVSRGANAASVVRSGAMSVSVRVPAGALVAPVVLSDTSLASIQADVPPSTSQWKVSPGAVGDPWVAAHADDRALALLRPAEWDDKSERMCLLQLPRPTLVAPGTEATFTVPVVICLAGVAVDITTPATSAPPQPATRCVASFDVALLRRRLLRSAALESLPEEIIEGGIRIPGEDYALSWDDVGRALSDRSPSPRWFLLPALGESNEPLLLLAFQDRHDFWRLRGTAGDPVEWIAEITAHLDAGTPRRASVPPPAREPPAPSASPLALATPERFGDFTTYDAATAEVVKQLRAAAPSSLSVLLLGESGTGKELLAAQLHRESGRTGPFVPVSCAAIAENLMESELFGHVSGAYTGARGDRPGAFVAAQGGTLFLDEIGDAPMSVQLGLLRALETRRVKPVGSDREVPVDVRVIAATSRDLDVLVQRERFRFDLYHRLAQLAVLIPPLRQRPADVDWLAEDLLKTLAPSRRFTESAKAALAAHPWPGNVRELRNTIERALALAPSSDPLDAADLMLRASASVPPRASASVPPPAAPRLVFSPEVRELAERALREGTMPKPTTTSPKRARADQRAAFLYLRTEQPLTAWSPALTRQFQRLFGPLWTSTEGGRGLAELMVTLALNPTDQRDKDEMAECLARAGVVASAD